MTLLSPLGLLMLFSIIITFVLLLVAAAHERWAQVVLLCVLITLLISIELILLQVLVVIP